MRKKPDVVFVIVAILALGIFATGASKAFSEKTVEAVPALQQGTQIIR